MIVKRSVTKSIIYVLVFAFLTILGMYMLYRGDNFGAIFTSIGLFFVIFFYFKGVKDKSTRIIIDHEGIFATEFKVDKIYWDDIKTVKIINYPRVGRIITFELFDESKYIEASLGYRSQRPKFSINRWLGVTTFYIMVEDLDVPPNKIYQEITAHIANPPADNIS